MVNKKFWLGILVLVLVFGMTVVGCEEPEDEADDWTNVTSLSQVNGTWKGSYTETENESGITIKMVMEMTVNINASAETMSGSMIMTMTFSGANINTVWADIKTGLAGEGFTFNDLTHTATMTESIPSESITLADMDGIQIDKSGTKLKLPAGQMGEDSPELILTKQ